MLDPFGYLTFLGACIALILVPGPAQALVLAATMARGKRAGVLTAVGLNVGTLVHAAAVALGLSAMLATSAVAFSIVKYTGAAYLVYLGIRALRSGANSRVARRSSTDMSRRWFIWPAVHGTVLSATSASRPCTAGSPAECSSRSV